jgi:hypothetical protein
MKHYSPTGRRDFWIRETGTGQQVAQIHERYMMMMMMMMTYIRVYMKISIIQNNDSFYVNRERYLKISKLENLS